MPDPAAPPNPPATVIRCDACGWQDATPERTRCPRCDAALRANDQLAEDATPFALSAKPDSAARKAMRWWVYRAGSGRLHHLIRVRRSARSRRFARRHVAVAAVAAALFQTSDYAWHYVRRTPDSAGLPLPEPTGSGWFSAGVVERTSDAVGLVALWWNLPRSLIVLVLGAAAAFFLGSIVLYVMHRGMAVSRRGASPHGSRGSAVFDYGTAWLAPVSIAGVLAAAAPLIDMLHVRRILPAWASGVLLIPAAVLAGLACIMWWFWLTRLAVAAPSSGRRLATAYYGLLVPAAVASLTLGWRAGSSRVYSTLWAAINLRWQNGL